MYIFTITKNTCNALPGVVCVSADGFAELGAYEYEGVFNVITFLVEGLNPEVVL